MGSAFGSAEILLFQALFGILIFMVGTRGEHVNIVTSFRRIYFFYFKIVAFMRKQFFFSTTLQFFDVIVGSAEWQASLTSVRATLVSIEKLQ